MNLSELRSQSQTLYAEKSATLSYVEAADWNQFINMGIKFLCTKGLIYTQTRTATILTTVASYVLPWDFIQFKGLLNASNLPLIEISPTLVGTVYIVTGKPLYYYVSQTALTSTTRANLTAYALGAFVTPSVANGCVYEAVTAGTSGAAPPTYLTVWGSRFTDGGVTWACREMMTKIWYLTLIDTPTTAGAGTGTYTLIYYAMDEGLGVDTDSPNFPVDKHYLLTFYACHLAAVKSKNRELASYFWDIFLRASGLESTQQERQ